MNRLNEFASAIKIHEGWYQGSRSYRSNNPGNLRWSKYQDGIQSGYSYFSTYQKGWDALIFDLKCKCLGNTKTGLGPDSTLLEFCEVWAPSFDKNNPKVYAEFLASKLNLSIYSRLKEIYSEGVEQKILVIIDAPTQEDIIKEAGYKIKDFFTLHGVETRIDFITINFPSTPQVEIQVMTGDGIVVKRNILDPAIIKKRFGEYLSGEHFAIYAFHVPPENTATSAEFSEVFKGAVIGQLPVLDVSNSDYIANFMCHEILHGWYHRLNAEVLLVKDSVHSHTWGDSRPEYNYSAIVKNLLPFLPVIFRPIQDKPYTPYIPPMTEPERQNYLVNFVNLIAKLLRGWTRPPTQ
jgi:hypothetical protein